MSRATEHEGVARALRSLRRKVRSIFRHRAFLLSLAVLPQLLALAVLVGIFWTVRVREILMVPARVAEIQHRDVLQCRISPGDVDKVGPGAQVEVELLGAGDEVEASGKGVITGQPRRENGYATIDINGPGMVELVRRAKLSDAPRVRIAVRTRRALTVILDARAGSAGRK